jgi:signal transduction histidine kinase
MRRLLPKSLFGRLVLVLFGGLLIAQLLSAYINFAERDRMLIRATGLQSGQRIAEVVKLLDSLGPQERQRIVTVLNIPPQVVSLEKAPIEPVNVVTDAPQLSLFSTVLRTALGDGREIRVAMRAVNDMQRPGFIPENREAMMDHQFPQFFMRRLMMGGVFFLTQVQLSDGAWVSFDTHMPRESASLPGRLLLTLTVLLLAVLGLSVMAVRWVTRPLHVLASAADELGRDINHPPLPENGPVEVRRAAHAFNSMQAKLVRFVQDRTRILTAMSHDLKTPITRMRLRAELLEDDELRGRFEKDLREMESMVTHTLDFIRGLGDGEVAHPVDIMALLESLQADNEEMGRRVVIEGVVRNHYVGVAPLLKRCLSNLIDNAVLYGKSATVIVEDGSDALCIRVKDEGPGIPEAELDKVFEPFYRLESSRNRETGGTGLGLAIARNIAQTHGGDIELHNRPKAGLEAVLTLPR